MKTPTTTSAPSPRLAAGSLALLMALSACVTNPSGPGSSGTGGSTASSYGMSCLTGAVVGGLAVALVDKALNKNKPVNKAKIGAGVAAGCFVGLASTAIGKAMDARQQQKHEEAMQAEVRRRALEQQNYAATTQRTQAMPAATPAQRAARDASLEKARAQYEASIAKPVSVDLGGGGQSTIAVAQPPANVDAGRPAACQDYSVLVNTPSGRARQFETWCPDAQGKMVRAEVRDATG